MNEFTAAYTVWRFRGVTTPDERVVVRRSEPGEERHVHEYQTILWKGVAQSKKEAFRQYEVSRGAA